MVGSRLPPASGQVIVVVAYVYVCGVSLLWWLPYPGWFQDAAPDGYQIMVGSRMPPASGQVIVVVAYIYVTGVN
jgi:hypothetical protein